MISIPGYDIALKLYEDTNSLVYRGQRKSDKNPVVLKLLNKSYPSPIELARFNHEYRMLASLNLEGVIRAYSLEKSGNSLVMVLEDFGGESLGRIIASGPLSLADFFPLSIRLADILGQVHQHDVMHKDINPSNIVWNPKTDQVKIIDFGIATELSRENLKACNPDILEGTLRYMSPEQTGRMNREVDYRTDFYSLGITFYELLTGTLPFHAEDKMGWVHCHMARAPIDPCTVNPEIPEAITEILSKLLAKNAEDRYQSALGLSRDLEVCRKQWQNKGLVENFTPGQWDVSERFHIPQKLYGREQEVAALMNAFETVAQGHTQLMLVAGYSGVGKSSLVSEVHKPIVEKQGYFIEGKFDQFQANIPYSALAQAFRGLVGQLLSEPGDRLELWKKKLLEALGPNGQIIIELVPELERVIGKQPPVQELNPTEAQNRFQMTFRNFVKVFARKEHPLVIFFDDLQWSDVPTLKSIESFMGSAEIRHLLLIGAYRDNEVHDGHPLMMTIDEVKKCETTSNRLLLQLFLDPLGLSTVNRIIADTLHCETERSRPLAELIFKKTNGNPFFVNELLKNLYRENCFSFVHEKGCWDWELEIIEEMGISENVVELMINRLKKLPTDTQNSLQMASCIGSTFDLKTLSLIEEQSPSRTARVLWEAVKQEIILPLGDQHRLAHTMPTCDQENETTAGGGLAASDLPSGKPDQGCDFEVSYRFQHDRVQQAAYALIADEHKNEVHLQIGRLMLLDTQAAELEEEVIEIVRQLNEGRTLIEDDKEREELARLNLMAGKKAKASIAYRPALQYFTTAMELLPPSPWENQYALTFEIFNAAAECAYICGEVELGETQSDILLTHARTRLEKADIFRMRLIQYTLLGKLESAIEQGKQGLSLLGIRMPAKATKLSVFKEVMWAKWALGRRKIADLIQLPLLSDPEKQLALTILMELGPAAYTAGDDNLLALAAIKQAHYSMRHGNALPSGYAYVCYSFILGFILGDLKSGYEFGKLGLKLNARFDSREMDCKVQSLYCIFVHHWHHHWKTIAHECSKAVELGMQSGEFRYTAYAAFVLPTWAIVSNIEQALQQREKTLSIIAETNYHDFWDITKITQQFLLNLQGRTNARLSLSDAAFDETKCLQRIEHFPTGLTVYYIYKLRIYYTYGCKPEALKCLCDADKWIHALLSSSQNVDFCLYAFLTLAAQLPEMKANEKRSAWKRMKKEYRQMSRWAEHCPVNFLHLRRLMEAEMARLSGKLQEAEIRFDQAIKTARENEFLCDEALANELAAKCCLAQEKEKIAGLYMKEARYLYTRWGASAKVEDLDEKYGHLLMERPERKDAAGKAGQASDTGSSKTSSDILDLTSVMKASQVISGEIIMDRLLKQLMLILIENAGAQKGCLILEREGILMVEARTDTDDNEKIVLAPLPMDAYKELSPAIVRYVIITDESVILDDASNEGLFTGDDYVRERKPKSLLCIPIKHHGNLVSVLYLENNHTIGAFTSERVDVLRTLTSQAAISIDNANTYNRLSESEMRYRSLFENAVEGISHSTPGGNILMANPAYAQILGYDSPDDLISSVTDLAVMTYVRPEERKRLQRMVEQEGQALGFETERYRKDGSVVWVSVNSRTVHDSDGNLLYYENLITDITHRKEAEQALHESLERYKLLMESSPVPITAYDQEGMVTYVNPAFTDLFGWSFEELIGKRLDFVPPHEAEKTLDAVKRTVAGERVLIDSQRFTKDGKVLDVQINSAPLIDHAGNLVGMFVMTRDITEMKRAERELVTHRDHLEQLVLERTVALEESEKQLRKAKEKAETATEAKSEFLASMSHEIRTPMNAILGMADLLSESPLNNEQQKYVQVFKNAGDSLLDLINDILDLSKVEAGQLSLEETSFDLLDFVERVCEVMALKAHEKKLELLFHLVPDTPVHLMGDPVRLRQILINLMGNAIKFTGEGEITLECGLWNADCGIACDTTEINDPESGREEVVLQFSVRDSGIGIPKEKRESIFESFTQADSSTTREYGGTGLGLTICRRLVEMMGGKIWIESEPGKGSTFFFTARFGIDREPEEEKRRVPVDVRGLSVLAADGEPDAPNVEDALVVPSLNILLVEDARENRIVIKAYLKKTPHKMGVAENGKIGLEKFISEDYDLVLMDMRMQVMDGYTATGEIRKWEEAHQRSATPIIALTAHALTEDRQKCLDAGCTDYLSKPLKKADLLRKIREYSGITGD